MTQTAHTPGPWQVVPWSSGEPGFNITGAMHNRAGLHHDTCDMVCTVDSLCGNPWQHGAAENAANARLIAAAPDLLAACETAEKSLLSDNPLDFKSGLNAIRAAIAKAKGEP